MSSITVSDGERCCKRGIDGFGARIPLMAEDTAPGWAWRVV